MTMATADDTDDAHAAAERSARWLTENAAALDSSNRYVEQHGLPLGQVRAQPQSGGDCGDEQAQADLFNILLAEDAIAGLKDAVAGRVLSEEETEAQLQQAARPRLA
jgi:hypothetical protein